MSDTYDLEYSNEALLSRVLFLSYENDINIFVEDIKKEFEYEELFERLFDDRDNVNPCDYIDTLTPVQIKKLRIK